MSIDDAIEAQRRTGQTSAQHQITDSGVFIRKAADDARRSIQASRDRGQVDATGIASIDLAQIPPEHVHGMSEALSSPIRRATARVGAIFPLASTHILALEKALKEEIALEFWNMRNQVQEDYRDLRDEVRGDFGSNPVGSGSVISAGDTQAGSGTVSSGGTVSQGGTVDNGGTISQGGSTTGSGTVGNVGSGSAGGVTSTSSATVEQVTSAGD